MQKRLQLPPTKHSFRGPRSQAVAAEITIPPELLNVNRSTKSYDDDDELLKRPLSASHKNTGSPRAPAGAGVSKPSTKRPGSATFNQGSPGRIDFFEPESRGNTLSHHEQKQHHEPKKKRGSSKRGSSNSSSIGSSSSRARNRGTIPLKRFSPVPTHALVDPGLPSPQRWRKIDRAHQQHPGAHTHTGSHGHTGSHKAKRPWRSEVERKLSAGDWPGEAATTYPPAPRYPPSELELVHNRAPDDEGDEGGEVEGEGEGEGDGEGDEGEGKGEGENGGATGVDGLTAATAAMLGAAPPPTPGTTEPKGIQSGVKMQQQQQQQKQPPQWKKRKLHFALGRGGHPTERIGSNFSPSARALGSPVRVLSQQHSRLLPKPRPAVVRGMASSLGAAARFGGINQVGIGQPTPLIRSPTPPAKIEFETEEAGAGTGRTSPDNRPGPAATTTAVKTIPCHEPGPRPEQKPEAEAEAEQEGKDGGGGGGG